MYWHKWQENVFRYQIVNKYEYLPIPLLNAVKVGIMTTLGSQWIHGLPFSCLTVVISCILTGSVWPLWRHPMETFPPLLDLCAGNSPIIGEFLSQWPVTWSLDVFFDRRLNKRWFETPTRSLWHHSNVLSSVGDAPPGVSLELGKSMVALVPVKLSYMWYIIYNIYIYRTCVNRQLLKHKKRNKSTNRVNISYRVMYIDMMTKWTFLTEGSLL